ncbi:MAG TPA: pseudouridine synthase [Candidatus Ozemobacteraceae bacterium]|nr:pseudouridine synthase [Candidatus Ozemobacteraceae bacterium]
MHDKDMPTDYGDGLQIIYRDEWYVAIHKPVGVLVHPTRIAEATAETLLPIICGQLGRRVYPVHRLDRATSGVLVLALSSEAAGKLSAQFEARKVEKTYLAVVRGWFRPPEGVIDRQMRQWPGEPLQDAVTRYRTLAAVELPIPVGPHQTSRYSLVEVNPETGRRQQIRRHFSGAAHPIVGDTSQGDRHHNLVFRERFGCDRMLLMAQEIRFDHPWLGRRLRLVCPPDESVRRILGTLFPESSPVAERPLAEFIDGSQESMACRTLAQR